MESHTMPFAAVGRAICTTFTPVPRKLVGATDSRAPGQGPARDEPRFVDEGPLPLASTSTARERRRHLSWSKVPRATKSGSRPSEEDPDAHVPDPVRPTGSSTASHHLRALARRAPQSSRRGARTASSHRLYAPPAWRSQDRGTASTNTK